MKSDLREFYLGIGLLVRKIRNEKGISARDLHIATGIFVPNMETRGVGMRISSLCAVAAALGVGVHTLLPEGLEEMASEALWEGNEERESAWRAATDKRLAKRREATAEKKKRKIKAKKSVDIN